MTQHPHPFAPYVTRDESYNELFGPLARCQHAVRLPQNDVFDVTRAPYVEMVAWLRDNARGVWFRVDDTRRIGSLVRREFDIGSLFYFEDAADAVFFKLRWYDSERV